MPFSPAAARRRFVATLAGAATALALMTATAVPARAAPDGEDLAKALAAIAVIALIAKANEDKGRKSSGSRDHGDRGDYHDGRGARVLPAECAIEVDRHGRGDRIVYSERCLRRSGVEGRLPFQCSNEVRVRGRSMTVFPQSCLLNAGFRPERGRSRW
jgi:hypothetical protein